MHLQAENYTEAGFTLKLYADMLSWDKEVLTFAQNDIIGQPEWQRKENLYHEVSSRFFLITVSMLLIDGLIYPNMAFV